MEKSFTNNIQISIIIVNYNTYDYTCKCIQSIVDYTEGVEFEIILVDNASIECDADVFKEKFPFIHLIKSKKNLGFAGGNNLGVEIARGDYILLLNSDTELIENCIAKTYNYAKTLSSLGAITCQLVEQDKVTIQHAAQPFPNVLLHLLQTTRLYYIFKVFYKKINTIYDYTTSFKAESIWGTFFMFPQDNLKYLGGKLTETFFMYWEDTEWSFIFKKNNLNNYYYADTKIIHYEGKSSKPIYKNKLIKENYYKFIRLYQGYQYVFLFILSENIDVIISRIVKFLKKNIMIYR